MGELESKSNLINEQETEANVQSGSTAYGSNLPPGLGAYGKVAPNFGANPYARQAAQQYKSTNVTTANPLTLVLMMYDGAVRFIRQGITAIEERDYEAANNNLGRAQDIVAELAAALDLGQGEIAENLQRMYDYMHSRLIEGNVRKDVEPLQEVIGLLRDLREAWEQIGRGEGAGRAGNES